MILRTLHKFYSKTLRQVQCRVLSVDDSLTDMAGRPVGATAHYRQLNITVRIEILKPNLSVKLVKIGKKCKRYILNILVAGFIL